MANGTLDELLIGLGFEYDPEDLEEFQSQLDGTVNLIKQLSKVAIAGATAITGLTIATTGATDEMGKFANEIGETVEMVDALQFANQRVGGTADGMAASLEELALRAGEAARGVGTGLEAFGILGINVTDANGAVRRSSDLILEVSQRLQQFDRSRQIELADKLGLRDAIRLLQQGPNAIRALTNEARALGVATEEDAAISADFRDSLTNLWQIVKQLSRVLTRSFAPILDSLVESFTDWWKINKDLIEQKIPEWIDTVIKGLKILSLIIGVLIVSRIATLTLAMFKLAAAMRAAGIATVLFKGSLLIIPALITAAVLLLVGVIEDAKTFFEGGDSLFGDLIARFPKFEKEIRMVAHLFNGIWEVTKLIVEGWEKLFNLFGGLMDRLPNIGVGAVLNLGQAREAREAREGFNFSDLFRGIQNIGFRNDASVPELQNNITNVTREGLNIPLGINSGGANQRNLYIDKIDINIPGSGDPRTTAEQVMSELLQQANQDFDSPVDQ